MKPSKPKLKTHFVAYVAASIDGRISLDEKTVPDWTSKEDWKFFQKGLSKADAVIAGRNTYLAAQKRLDKRNTFVFTSTVTKLSKKGNVMFLNPKHTNLSQLFQEYTTVVIVGGARVYQTMLEHNMLDELFVTIEPLVFGRGQTMFSNGTKNSRLKLKNVRKLNKKGTLLLHYVR